MPFQTLFLLAGAVSLLLMTLLWLFSLRLKDSSIVDIFWGIGFIILVWLAFALTPQGYLPRKILLGILVTIWGLRLAAHIGFRNAGKPEDFRYAKWRAEYGARWWWFSFFQVFLLQGCIMWLISAPIIAALTSGFPAILTPLDWLGVLLWALGLLFESIGDAQLMLFKADPGNKDKLLTKGLWKYTRHPNYFGEAVIWWGFYIIALAAGRWWTIFSPILMTYLLIKISGVAMLERTMKQKPGYQEYMRKTSAFFPWFPGRREKI
jgi:steroid 5-alpha reductase family enzyme